MARQVAENMSVCNFDLAQGDADRIKEQSEKIDELEKIIKLDRRMFRQEKMQIYRDMKKK